MPANWFAQADPGLLARRGLVLVLVLGAMAGVMLLGWDQSLRVALGHFGKTGFGHAWGISAYWMGLGGVQLAGAVAFIALAIWARSLRWRSIGISCLWAVAVSGIMVQVIKHLVGRARPRTGLAADTLLGLTMNSDMHSFPSGHTATSFALAAWLATRYPEYGVVYYGLAVYISLGRIISGSHYASDVLGGMALGLMVGWIMDFRRRAKEVPA
ncbi:MAG: phosphatase PAP2 family protein [Desulfarculaceae bacterium]|nr:phosphatase PAP2 family protein [Desulfarculaceae bacterium]MCF8046658.1 phosphatase PAP2 family protein [Desulfarculaceae bacterium]MCF8065578.1 phosphatase PAP2 family protein [Desulfarculaceae bacterium]MCF8096840.1 phosphatase PAP2 family protein [Desulfarculaceae bacterium]MCF8121850.1 phosphatase PAP2 family protein [Desulfarculaceae bacterium]